MAIWLGDLQERTLCGMLYVGVLACSWGHLREEAESCRVHVQVRVTIQRRRGEPSRDKRQQDNACVGRARSRLLELAAL
jgi:hypothetical protein